MKQFLTTDEINTCPLCNAYPLPEDKQPVAGLHCYTIKYECGAQVVCAFGYEEFTVDLKCGEVEEDLIETLRRVKKFTSKEHFSNGGGI